MCFVLLRLMYWSLGDADARVHFVICRLAVMCLVEVFDSCCLVFFFFKQKTASELRISDWSSDVCSSDLLYRGTEIVELARGDLVAPRLDVAAHPELLDQRRGVGRVLAIFLFLRGRHREDKSFHIGHRLSPLFLSPSCRKGGIGCKRVCFVTLRPLHIRHPELVSGSRSCPRIWRGAQGETWPWMLKQVQHDDGGEGGLIPPPGRPPRGTRRAAPSARGRTPVGPGNAPDRPRASDARRPRRSRFPRAAPSPSRYRRR